MKFYFTFIPLLLLVSLSGAYAQVMEDGQAMSQGIQNAFSIDIPDTNEKFVEGIWRKYMKQYGGKSKRNRKTDETFTEGTRIREISPDKINLYAMFTQEGDNVKLSIWVDMDGTYLSSEEHPDRFYGAQELLTNFKEEVRTSIVKIQVKEEENNLKKAEAKLKKLKKENDRYQREIEQAKAKIEKAEANIETNLIEQEEAQKSIEQQILLLEQVRNKLNPDDQ